MFTYVSGGTACKKNVLDVSKLWSKYFQLFSSKPNSNLKVTNTLEIT
jgi:hypothetical protein